mgnify:CR=1 FL=1
MNWTFSPYLLPLVTSTLMALVVAAIVARRRERVGARSLAWVMRALALWSASSAMELVTPAPEAKLLFANLAYVGIVSVPVLWVIFAAEYAVGSRHLSGWHLLALCIIPTITLALVWANPSNSLMRRTTRLVALDGIAIVERDFGPWFVVHTVYSYLLILSGAVLLLRVLVRSPYLYRRQAMALLVASLLPLVGNIVYLVVPRSVIPIDVTPMTFAITGAVIAYGVGRFGILDVVPAARDAVVEGMRDALLVMDAENHIVDLNENAVEVLGRPRAACIGVPVSDLIPASAELLHTRTAQEEDIELLLEPRGARHCYEVRSSALYDGRGRLTGRLAVLRDVTLQRRAEQEREALLREVERRAQQLSALASELTQAEERERRRLAQTLHDHLQQLLVGAKMHAIALRNQVDDQRFAVALQQVVALLDQSLAASRALTVELSPPVLHEGTLAQALSWLAQWVHERHGLEVAIRLDPHAEPAGDDVRILLFQAARELLFNVVKHAQVERAYLGMRIVDHTTLELVVADEGVGFDASPANDALIAPSGFGLFSIRERLQLLGGRMEVVSSPKRGTRVTLYAPATPSPVAVPVAEPAQPAAPVASGGDVRVLLVDDHRTVREGLAALLRDEQGIRVVGEATNGPMALELAARLRPDVVVMDVTLPGMSGIEATRRLRERWPEMRVVGLSAHAQPDIAGAMRAAGAVTYLDKGGPAEALIAAIRGQDLYQSRTANRQP